MTRTTPLALTAAVLSLGLALTGCANSSDSGSGSGGSGSGAKKDLPAIDKIDLPNGAQWAKGKGDAKCDAATTLAYVGAETGPNAQLGINIVNGVQQAIDEHNAANPDCQVKFKKYDTEGDPSKATGPVAQVTTEQSIIGVVGLPFSGESKATGGTFEQAGLVHVTPAATNPALTGNGWSTFFRGLGNDAVQGPAAAKMMTEQLGAEKVYVVQDDSEYGMGLGETTKSALGGKLAGEDRTTKNNKDFGAIVSKIVSAKPDAVFYSGYYAEASPFVSQLRAKGFKGAIVGPDGVKDEEFVKQAGSAADGTYFTCPCIPGELIPEFAKAYEKVSAGRAPGTYSIEGYDATTVLLRGIDAGKKTRAELKEWVKTYDADGLSKKYKWDDKGELQTPAVYGYKVENGKIVSVGQIGK